MVAESLIKIKEELYKSTFQLNNTKRRPNAEFDFFPFDIDKLFEFSSVQKLKKVDANLVKLLIKTAMHDSADKPITYNNIYFGLLDQEQTNNSISVKKVIETKDATYTIDEECKHISCEECKERYNAVMHTSIPLSYAIFGAVMFALLCVFGTFLFIAISNSVYVINPRFSLISFLGSLVLLLTDIAAYYSWRKLINVQKKNR